jgi:hypothetical protein
MKPIVRCGDVPFGAENCTIPNAKAVIAAKAWSTIAGVALVEQGSSGPFNELQDGLRA